MYMKAVVIFKKSLVKAMWALGLENSSTEMENIMKQNITGEFYQSSFSS